MDDPIKIIFKYKNNNRRIQYQKYIFTNPGRSPEFPNKSYRSFHRLATALPAFADQNQSAGFFSH